MARFEDRAGLPEARAAELASAIADHQMLHEVVAWMARVEPQPEIVRIVEQDEYSLDVVLRLEDDIWLVYDCS